LNWFKRLTIVYAQVIELWKPTVQKWVDCSIAHGYSLPTSGLLGLLSVLVVTWLLFLIDRLGYLESVVGSLWILFLADVKNDKVAYKSGDLREAEAYSFSGSAPIWVLDNTDSGYNRVLALYGSADQYVVTPNQRLALRIKGALIPELLTESEREFLNPSESDDKVVVWNPLLSS
jgi:hypothetical protein